jgi:serine/threonine protein kinase
MSEVYHGYDERLDRRVAIKVLRPPGQVPAAPDSPEAVEILDALDRDRKRFLREIRVTAQLEHPGTPAVYDTGIEKAPDGSTRLWLVMQLLRGSTLEALLNHADYQSSPPSVAWAAAIAAQIAAVLADVHRVDIVHRDIKPGNVMIADGGGHAAAFVPPEYAGAGRAVTAGRCTCRAGHVGVLDAGERPGRAADGGGSVRGAAAVDVDGTRIGGPRFGRSSRRPGNPRPHAAVPMAAAGPRAQQACPGREPG